MQAKQLHIEEKKKKKYEKVNACNNNKKCNI